MHINDYDYELPPELIAKRPLDQRDACRLLYLKRGNGGINNRVDNNVADNVDNNVDNIISNDNDNNVSNNADNNITNNVNNTIIKHLTFRDILTLLRRGDRLVFNDSRVIPARVFCRKITTDKTGATGTGANVELFFTERINERSWKALVKPGKRAPVGTTLCVINDDTIKIRVDDVMCDGYERVVSIVQDECMSDDICALDNNHTQNNDRAHNHARNNGRPLITLDDVIDKHGRIPLPHYMDREDDAADREAYQTVYAKRAGAVAAPTAGLHFTNELLDELAARGVDKSFVTLHVGIGTFRPVQTDDPRDHDIHEERFELDEKTARELSETWERGGRVIAVGTTVVRTLESCAKSYHKVEPTCAKTKLMILPPYKFNAVDALITNFHLPKSTLLMLVSAFASRESVLEAYRLAAAHGYRFFSYGDAMFIE